jgi:hypothetical protein
MDITSTRSWAFVTLTLCSKNKDDTNLLREHVCTDTRLRANGDNNPKQSAQRSKAKRAMMSKAKCATVLKAKIVHNDAQGKCAKMPRAKFAEIPRTKRGSKGCRPSELTTPRVPMQSTALSADTMMQRKERGVIFVQPSGGRSTSGRATDGIGIDGCR